MTDRVVKKEPGEKLSEHVQEVSDRGGLRRSRPSDRRERGSEPGAFRSRTGRER